MNTPERHRSKRHPDEQDLVRIVSGSDELRQLLAAAAVAPPARAASPAELAGQARALAFFRAARVAATQPLTTLEPDVGQPLAAEELPASRTEFAVGPTGRGEPRRQAARRSARIAAACRTRTIKVAIASGLSALVLAGMGVAAAAGGLPVPLQDAVHNLFNAPAPDISSSAATVPNSRVPNSTVPNSRVPNSTVPLRSTPASTPAQPSASLSRAPSGARLSASRPPAGPVRSQLPSGVAASVAGLCRAYHAGNKSARTLRAPGFATLVRAAGGATRVQAYCTKLTGTARPSNPAAKPSSPAAKPSSPAAKPTSSAAKRSSPAAKSGASAAKSSRPLAADRARSAESGRPSARGANQPGDNQPVSEPPGDNGNPGRSAN
jgi:hypothetical protein